MSRMPITKQLINTKLLHEYGGWIYCSGCDKPIGNLCYVTYDRFQFNYKCKCGGSGSVSLSFAEEHSASECREPLLLIKNRWCCPCDQSPLFSVVAKNLSSYHFEVVCRECKSKFVGEQTL